MRHRHRRPGRYRGVYQRYGRLQAASGRNGLRAAEERRERGRKKRACRLGFDRAPGDRPVTDLAREKNRRLRTTTRDRFTKLCVERGKGEKGRRTEITLAPSLHKILGLRSAPSRRLVLRSCRSRGGRKKSLRKRLTRRDGQREGKGDVTTDKKDRGKFRAAQALECRAVIRGFMFLRERRPTRPPIVAGKNAIIKTA